MKLGQFICYRFLFSITFVALTVHKTQKGIQTYMNNQPIKTFGLTHWTIQCARSRLVQPKTKQLCTLLLKFFEFHNQFDLLTMIWPYWTILRTFLNTLSKISQNVPYSVLFHTFVSF